MSSFKEFVKDNDIVIIATAPILLVIIMILIVLVGYYQDEQRDFEFQKTLKVQQAVDSSSQMCNKFKDFDTYTMCVDRVMKRFEEINK